MRKASATPVPLPHSCRGPVRRLAARAGRAVVEGCVLADKLHSDPLKEATWVCCERIYDMQTAACPA